MVENRDRQPGNLDKLIPTPQLAGFLRDVIGPKITALILFSDVKNPEKIISVKDLDGVVDGSREISPEMETRIRTAHQITEMLSTVGAPPTIRAWFIGMNPVLEDRSPALEIAARPEEALNAAKAFMTE